MFDICSFLGFYPSYIQQLTRTAISLSKRRPVASLQQRVRYDGQGPVELVLLHLAQSVTALTCVLGPSTCPGVCNGRSGGGGADSVNDRSGGHAAVVDRQNPQDRLDRLYAQSRTYVINSVKLEELWVSLGEEASAEKMVGAHAGKVFADEVAAALGFESL